MATKKLEEQVEENTMMLKVIERDIDKIKNNHLFHIERDMDSIRQTVDKMDTRMWAILLLLITASVGSIFGDKIIGLL